MSIQAFGSTCLFMYTGLAFSIIRLRVDTADCYGSCPGNLASLSGAGAGGIGPDSTIRSVQAQNAAQCTNLCHVGWEQSVQRGVGHTKKSAAPKGSECRLN